MVSPSVTRYLCMQDGQADPAPQRTARTISQTWTLVGQHHPFLSGPIRVSTGTSETLSGPKEELRRVQVSHLPVPDLLQGLTCSSLPRLWMWTACWGLGVLGSPSSQTCCFASLGIPGLGHLSVIAKARENLTSTTFCQAHCRALKHEPVDMEAKIWAFLLQLNSERGLREDVSFPRTPSFR